MTKLIQDLKSGKIELIDLPCPAPKKNEYLIKTTNTLISTGTEKMLLQFGKANLIDKARQQPEKVKMVLDKIKSDGLAQTVESVLSRLNEPLEMGYCNVGVVEESISGGFSKGTRVVSNGSHSSYVTVNKNLVAKIPENVSDELASFCIPASIALQGIRLLNPQIGESVLIIGLGLIGLLSAQILKANGCEVFATDIDENKCKIAESYGVTTFLSQTSDNGSFAKSKNEFDYVLITASANDKQIIKDAANACRKRGKIVLIGVINLDIDRSDFYEKELTFQVSCSYGPGRYDNNYEEKALDYPIEYVRWTENRNFQAVLNLMSDGKICYKKLLSNKFDIKKAVEAYDEVLKGESLGTILKFSDQVRKTSISLSEKTSNNSDLKVSFVGAGNYATRVLIPLFKKNGFELISLCSKGGLSTRLSGEKFGFKNITTDFKDVLSDESTLVVIATTHNLHAQQSIETLKAKKNVFVEKPLAINFEEMNDLIENYKKSENQVMVGFNRRFSPQILTIKKSLDRFKLPVSIIYTINAGHIDKDNWIQDKSIGGGRIIGEVCHFVDLICFLTNSEVEEINNSKLTYDNDLPKDTISINLKFKNGSIANINYFSNGAKSFPKERLEIFCSDKIATLDNFKKLTSYNWPDIQSKSNFAINKGQDEMIKKLKSNILEKSSFPISFNEIVNTTKICLDIEDK